MKTNLKKSYTSYMKLYDIYKLYEELYEDKKSTKQYKYLMLR